MLPSHKDLLQKGAFEFGIGLSQEQLDKFFIFLKELKEWNNIINLTSIIVDQDIIIKHFIDSLSLTPHIKNDSFVMDIGSGAGFPGIPLKIALPDLRVLLLEATNKKVAFLKHIIRTLGLTKINAICQRAEDTAFQEVIGSTLDFVVIRAVGDLVSVVKLGAPFIKNDGRIIVMRGKSTIKREKGELKTLEDDGIILAHDHYFKLPFGGGERTILLFARK